MNEYHNVGRVDATIRVVLALVALALVAAVVRTGADYAFLAFLIVMPVFAYLLITALIREDVLYILWDINTRAGRGHMWAGHHGDRGSRFE